VHMEGCSSPGGPAYAGIGPRATPARAREAIEAAAEQFARGGWTMRTGMSPGADQAFYRGASSGHGWIELYLPWPAFEAGARSPGEGSNVFVLPDPTEAAYALAARFHPSWRSLTPSARKLRARDCHEVLGRDLKSPVRLVLCWTPHGDLDGTGPGVGGTGQALRIAQHQGIPVLNLARPDHLTMLSRHALADPNPS